MRAGSQSLVILIYFIYLVFISHIVCGVVQRFSILVHMRHVCLWRGDGGTWTAAAYKAGCQSTRLLARLVTRLHSLASLDGSRWRRVAHTVR